MDTLPQEILYHICEELTEAKSSLAVCALVSYRWVEPARSQLFSALSISANDNFFAFLTTFLKPNPHLAKYIRKLTLGRIVFRPTDYCTITPCRLLELVMHLPHLQHLSIRNTSILLPPVPLGQILPAAPSKLPLKRLEINACDGGVAPAFMLISLFSIGHLDFRWGPTSEHYVTDYDDWYFSSHNLDTIPPCFSVDSLCLQVETFGAMSPFVTNGLRHVLPRVSAQSLRYWTTSRPNDNAYTLPSLTGLLSHTSHSIVELGLTLGECVAHAPANSP